MEIEEIIHTLEVFVENNPRTKYGKKFLNELYELYPNSIIKKPLRNTDNAMMAKETFEIITGVYSEFTQYLEYLGKITEIDVIRFWFKMKLRLSAFNETFTLYITVLDNPGRKYVSGVSNVYYVFEQDGIGLDVEDSLGIHKYWRIKDFLKRRGLELKYELTEYEENDFYENIKDNFDEENEIKLVIR